MGLGKRIRELRLERGWTLEQLSDASGVDVGTISALEMRDSKRSNYAAALAAALGVTVEQLSAGDKTVRTPGPATAPRDHISAPPTPIHAAEGTPTPYKRLFGWPFPDVSPADFERLTDLEKSEVQGFVKALISRRKLLTA